MMMKKHLEIMSIASFLVVALCTRAIADDYSQNFDDPLNGWGAPTWDSVSNPWPPTWGDHFNWNDFWSVSQGIVEDDQMGAWYAPASLSFAAWLMDYASAPANPPYIMSTCLSNGIGTVSFASLSTASGENIISVETGDSTNWTVHGFITNSSISGWVTNSIQLNINGNTYLRLVKTNDLGTAGQYLG